MNSAEIRVGSFNLEENRIKIIKNWFEQFHKRLNATKLYNIGFSKVISLYNCSYISKGSDERYNEGSIAFVIKTTLKKKDQVSM